MSAGGRASARRTAVVTGAASGIGRAVVEQLLDAGECVVAVDRDPAVASIFEEAVTVVADVRDESEHGRIRDAAGPVDYLVNAAGVIRIAPIEQVTSTEWDLVLDVNAKALFFLTRELAPQMKAGSAIVNVASTAGKAPITTETAPYNASKAAVIALTKTFAYAYASRGIRVNCVCPGNVATPMHDMVTAELAKVRDVSVDAVEAAYNRSIPLARAATPEEIADTILFLLSDRATYMTGQAVNVSGGLVMY